MVMHVVNRTARARSVSRVIVATDDPRIVTAVQLHGAEARLTSPTAASGTDRVAEAAAGLVETEIVVNVQGDEPLIDPATIDSAVESLLDTPDAQIATTSEPIVSPRDVFNPNVVKVVTDAKGFALYFSRSPIPHVRSATNGVFEEVLEHDASLLVSYRKHSGLYAYRWDVLQQLAAVTPSRLERLEALEQLRAVENGFRIRVVHVEHRSIGVDTRQDYELVKKMIEENEK